MKRVILELPAIHYELRGAPWEARMTDVPSSIVQAKAFLRYCEAHPEQRFWQALRNWAGVRHIGVSNDKLDWIDTFHFTDDVARRYPDAEDRRLDGELETEIIRLRAENKRLRVALGARL